LQNWFASGHPFPFFVEQVDDHAGQRRDDLAAGDCVLC